MAAHTIRFDCPKLNGVAFLHAMQGAVDAHQLNLWVEVELLKVSW